MDRAPPHLMLSTEVLVQPFEFCMKTEDVGGQKFTLPKVALCKYVDRNRYLRIGGRVLVVGYQQLEKNRTLPLLLLLQDLDHSCARGAGVKMGNVCYGMLQAAAFLGEVFPRVALFS